MKLPSSRMKNKSFPGHLVQKIKKTAIKPITLTAFGTTIHNPELKHFQVTEEEVSAALRQADGSKAPRPDGIPTRVLKDKDCAEEITPHLTSPSSNQLYTRNERKQTYQYQKKGDTTNFSISLRSIFSKLLERCSYNKIIDNIGPK